MTQHLITGDGVKLSYERRGEGPAVVLVQGLSMPGKMWLRLPSVLVEAGFQVITPDTRGTGSSSAPPPPYRMTTLAEDLSAVLRDAASGPALVAGISLGGMIAQHLALRHPTLVRGLVLAATTCGLPFGRPPDPTSIALIVAAMSGRPALVRRLRLRLVHPSALARDPELFAPWDERSRAVDFPLQGVFGQLAAAATHNTGRKLRELRCPTEVICGDHDQVIPPVNSRILARRIPGAHLTVVPRAGHVFPLEQPRALVEAILRVDRRSSPAS